MITVAIAIYKLNLPNRPYDEVFAKIDRFSRYMASNYGLIFDTKNNKLVSQFKYRDENQNKTKYYYKVNVVDDYGKKHCARVNRLVLMAFQPLEDYSSVESNHKNLDTENNCLYNLEWTTHLENVQHYCKSINSNALTLFTKLTISFLSNCTKFKFCKSFSVIFVVNCFSFKKLFTFSVSSLSFTERDNIGVPVALSISLPSLSVTGI